MKKICLTMALSISAPAFAQETSSEHVEVTGSRIPSSVFGPIAMAGSSIGETGKGCAEPNCGEAPQDPGGGDSLTQQQKNTNNKKAQEKAKQPKNKDKLAQNMKQDQSTIQKVLDWMKGISVDWGAKGWIKVTTPNVSVEGEGCLQQHAKINQDSPEAKDYCVERKVDTETVKKANGAYETQLLLTYSIYDTCYWEKTCDVEYISFVAASPEELHGFLNEVIGEQVY